MELQESDYSSTYHDHSTIPQISLHDLAVSKESAYKTYSSCLLLSIGNYPIQLMKIVTELLAAL